jgi:hypothetical protein
MVKQLVILTVCITAIAQGLRAQTTTVNLSSGGTELMLNQNGVALTAGPAGDGNGAALLLGYFTMGTTSDPFAGNFVALSGEGSANTAVVPGSVPAETYQQTSIGDIEANGAGADGTFSMSLNFTTTDPTSNHDLPPSTSIPLVIRFYNGTTIAGSTFFNTVSDALWVWAAPAIPPSAVNLSFDDPGLIWQDARNPFKTTIAVPEPSALALLGLGCALIPLFRRRTA